MGDRRPVRRKKADAVTASAMPLTAQNTRTLFLRPTEWQNEAWDAYHSLGELYYAINDWFGNGMSRIRLIAAETRTNEDPLPITEGPAADIVAELANGIGGQAALLKKFAVQLSVPGESFLVGEQLPGSDTRTWTVYSNSEIRLIGHETRGGFGEPVVDFAVYEVMYGDQLWRRLGEESMVVRIWNPDHQFQYRAYSAVGAALPLIREIDFYNRYIISVLLSRLSLNGILLIPAEVDFPTKPDFKDQSDPFIAELLDIARKSIANPGSPQASLPLPLRVPAEMIEKFKHLTFDSPVGAEVIENRQRALGRLATALNIPGEVLTGMENMNHWGQWQLEESAVKIHFSPVAEVICVGLTVGYLLPMLAAAGLSDTAPGGGRYIVWYDPSPITQTPDRGKPSQDLYDRGEIKGEVLRRANGFDENDKPNPAELKTMVLQNIALAGGADALFALSKLTGDSSLVPPTPQPVAPESPSGNDEEPSAADQQQAPDTRPEDEVVES